MNLLKFLEFLTFCRCFGASARRFAAIDQPGKTLVRIHWRVMA